MDIVGDIHLGPLLFLDCQLGWGKIGVAARNEIEPKLSLLFMQGSRVRPAGGLPPFIRPELGGLSEYFISTIVLFLIAKGRSECSGKSRVHLITTTCATLGLVDPLWSHLTISR